MASEKEASFSKNMRTGKEAESWQKADSYDKVEKYLEEVPKFTQKNGLEDTACFLKVLGSPGEKRKIIHIAGTNGKGSVCAYLCSVLKEAGYSVGMFTSPHLVELRERFRINGIPVEKEMVTGAFGQVMERLEEMRGVSGKKEYHPTFFELLFLMGMVIFEQKETDYIILETGLGGRLDATNAIKNPVLTVITEIGFDHMEYLGDTIGKIAAEKAGICKPGVAVVFCDKRKEATEVIQNRAQMLENRAVAVNEEEGLHRNFTKKSIDFSVYSRYYGYVRLKLQTSALYQTENAVIAFRCIEELPDRESITEEHITRGFFNTIWEGRMEEVLPGVFVDGAHNGDGIKAFLRSVEVDGCRGNRYLLFSSVQDKDYRTMIEALEDKELFTGIAVSRIHDKRAADPESLRRIFDTYEGRDRCIYKENTQEALDYLLNRKEEEDHIYIAGSLYLVGEVKALLRRKTDD